MGNSALGLVDIYNLLPQTVVDAPTVRLFQRGLQDMLRIEAMKEDAAWPNLFSPRNALWCHKLIGWRAYNNGTATAIATIATTGNAPSRN